MPAKRQPLNQVMAILTRLCLLGVSYITSSIEVTTQREISHASCITLRLVLPYHASSCGSYFSSNESPGSPTPFLSPPPLP